MRTRFISFLTVVLFLPTFAFANYSKPLSDNSRLQKVAEAIGTQLGDENISNGGVTALSARQLTDAAPKVKNELKKIVLGLFEKSFLYHQDTKLPSIDNVQLEVTKFKPAMVSGIVTALMEGNAYDPENKETIAHLTSKVWAVLRQLPVNEKSVVATIKTFNYSEEFGTHYDVYYFVILDAKTSKFVDVFVVEGSM